MLLMVVLLCGGCSRSNTLASADVESIHALVLQRLVSKRPDTSLFFLGVADTRDAKEHAPNSAILHLLKSRAKFRSVDVVTFASSGPDGATIAIDRDTGEKGWLAVSQILLTSRDLVEVEGTLTDGPLSGGAFIFSCRRGESRWSIESEKTGRIF